MIKKIFALFMAFVLCVAATYMDSEQKYFFASDALIEALQNNVEDEQKRTDAATKYSELMNQETGMVSIDNLFAVCRTAGFNTYRKEGFDSCKQFINTLIELDENALSGFCPGLDEKGNNPNSLKSITNETRVGDFCSSTNIKYGEVVFERNNRYSCTCMAAACNYGFEFKGGACVTRVADGNGNCFREIYPENNDNNTMEKCKNFCGQKYNGRQCKYHGAVMRHSTKECICNPTSDEIDNAIASMRAAEKRQIQNIKYFAVCDSAKTGKTEYCEKDFFADTQTQVDQAIGFAKDYAKTKHGNTVYCNTKPREYNNDDYIACATLDGNVFYEFKFDDVTESYDSQRRMLERAALCRLGGGSPSNAITLSSVVCKIVPGVPILPVCINNFNTICENLDRAKCSSFDNLTKRYGHGVTWKDNKCRFTDYGYNTQTSESFSEYLAKIEGLDNYAFFKTQLIANRGNFVLIDELENYVGSKMPRYRKFSCNDGYDTIKIADGILANIVGNHDDIKHCYVDDKPIDFVFDDLSEVMKYERDAGESGVKCVTQNGKFDGHYCRGLTKDECFELEKLMLAQLKTSGWAGDDDLVDWDEEAGACELNAAQFANNVNKTGKYTAIAGLTIGGVFTGGSTTALAIGLMAVELGGMAGEIYVQRKKELLPQEWANEFLAQSTVCKRPSCAEMALNDNLGKISQASDMLNRDVLKTVDNELARLAEMLPEDRLRELYANAKEPDCWETWECQENIFIGMQMVSLAAGVAKGLANFSRVMGKRIGVVANKSNALVKVSSHADDANGAIVKAAAKADKADDVTGAVWDATAKRFRDPKTGRFVSGYTSWNKELAEIGVKESVVNGKTVYTDIKTGKALSETQVLNKIPTSTNDDFAKIGVRQIEQSDGSVRYMDIRPGGGNKFISEAEVLKRIDDMPVSATKAVDDVADKTSSVTRTVSKTENVSALRNKVSDVFDAHLADVKRGKKVALFDKSKLTDEEWQMLNKSLEKEGVKLEKDAFGNMELKRIESTSGIRMSTAETARGAKAADATKDAGKAADKAVEEAEKLFDLKFPGFKKAGNGEFKVSDKTFSWALGQEKAEALMREGYYAKIVPTKGVSEGEEYVVVAIKKSDVSGQLMWDGENLVKQVDNSAFLRNLDVYRSEEITKIGNTPVFIEDVGSISGRGIVTVRVGEKKIPFYVSTGTAGKTAVPTGKWEVFWGIGEDGWFNKAGIKEINNHYDSEELRQIAYALDSKLGDPRSTELVLETIGRNSQGGTGIVGLADIGPISENAINSGFKSTPGTYSNSWHMHENIHDVTEYLKNLH